MTPEQEKLIQLFEQVYPPETRRDLEPFLKKSIIQAIVGRWIKPTFCETDDPFGMARRLLEEADPDNDPAPFDRDTRAEFFFRSRSRTAGSSARAT